MNIVVVGAGSFGTALAEELSAQPKNKITLLFRNPDTRDRFNETKINEPYFPNRKLDAQLQATCDFNVLADADVVFIAVPTKNIADLARTINPHLKSHTLLVNLSKGIIDNGRTIVEYLKAELGHDNTVSLKGPSFSVEMINHQATLLTLGFEKRAQLKTMKALTADTNIFLDYTADIRGVELLSALKNIYAIVLGNVDAKYNSANTRFLVLTKAFAEIKLILTHFGGREDTLFLGCGLGDINLTALNDLSRNRTLGLLIGKGFYNPSYQNNSVVLEGIKTLNLIKTLIPDSLMGRLPMLQQIQNFFLDDHKTEMPLDFEALFKKRFKTVLTYGTYDLLHFGHLEILRRAKELGDELIVGLSTDEFNQEKGKTCRFSYAKRKAFLESLSYVDLVIPEQNWDQKKQDVQDYDVDMFVMGHDWEGKFDFLKERCEVHYFPRTKGISTTKLKQMLKE